MSEVDFKYTLQKNHGPLALFLGSFVCLSTVDNFMDREAVSHIEGLLLTTKSPEILDTD